MYLRAMKLGAFLECWAALLVGLALTAGCAEQNKPAGTPIEQAWERPPSPQPVAAGGSDSATTQPASAPAAETAVAPEPPDAVLAVVNGKPIARGQLLRILVETHGLPLLEQMILLTAAQQRAAEMGLTVTPADITAAYEDALRRISTPVGGEGAPLDRAAAERLLSEFLEAKNLSRAEWDLRMRQRAYVHKIAAAELSKLPVTEEMLRDEYKRAFGARVQIRHIQVSTLAAVERVRKALAGGADFAAVAREMSENQITGAGGGLMPPFTRNDGDVPPLIREMAFRMKPGEISTAVQQDNWYHVLKLERQFPASGVTFENADRDALKKRLLDRLTRQRQETLEVELFRGARVDIHDATLSKQFRDKHSR